MSNVTADHIYANLSKWKKSWYSVVKFIVFLFIVKKKKRIWNNHKNSVIKKIITKINFTVRNNCLFEKKSPPFFLFYEHEMNNIWKNVHGLYYLENINERNKLKVFNFNLSFTGNN